MEVDKRVEALETEFKLMKGELKQTLSGVRDYLLDLKLPPSQEATLLAAAMTGTGSDLSMDGKFSIEKPENQGGAATDMLGGGEAGGETEAGEEAGEGEAAGEGEDAAGEENTEETGAEEETPEEETAMDQLQTAGEVGLAVPPVNLLANLIRWVANAKRDIGDRQLPTFLEVYGVSGHLSPELKDTILHLAEITAASESAISTSADVWSQLMLELHGILAGGDAPLRPLGPLWNTGAPQRPEEKRKPSKLKLVLSGGDGKDQEFSLDLKPEEE